MLSWQIPCVYLLLPGFKKFLKYFLIIVVNFWNLAVLKNQKLK